MPIRDNARSAEFCGSRIGPMTRNRDDTVHQLPPNRPSAAVPPEIERSGARLDPERPDRTAPAVGSPRVWVRSGRGRAPVCTDLRIASEPRSRIPSRSARMPLEQPREADRLRAETIRRSGSSQSGDCRRPGFRRSPAVRSPAPIRGALPTRGGLEALADPCLRVERPPIPGGHRGSLFRVQRTQNRKGPNPGGRFSGCPTSTSL